MKKTITQSRIIKAPAPEASNLKVYVGVKAQFTPDGQLIPRSVIWEDGREYIIDRVTDVRRAASLKAGGSGMRYTVRICSSETFLFFEEDKWFVERRRQ